MTAVDAEGFVRAVESAAVAEGDVIGVVVEGNAIALARSGGRVHAMFDACSHQQCPLSTGFVEDGQIECECHGAMFDLETGAATYLPATEPIQLVPVRESNGAVFVRVARQ